MPFRVLGFPQFTLFFNRTLIRKLRCHSKPLYQLSYLGKITLLKSSNFSPLRFIAEEIQFILQINKDTKKHVSFLGRQEPAKKRVFLRALRIGNF